MSSKPNLSPLEAEEAQTLMEYMHARNLKFTHIRNETGRADSNGEIRNMRALLDYQAGVSPGFPDFAVVLPHVGLLLIELKRTEGSNTSEAQLSWIAALNTCPGVESHVCKGAAVAIDLIEEISPSKRR